MTAQQNQLWFHFMKRVRYAEIDQMGVVYHTHYLNWLEFARTEYIRALGIPYKKVEERGLLLPVIDLEVKFKRPAYYDDQISIYARVIECTHLRLVFEYEVRRGEPGDSGESEESYPTQGPTSSFVGQEAMSGDLLVTGITRHVWTCREFKPQRLDKSAPDLYAILCGHLTR